MIRCDKRTDVTIKETANIASVKNTESCLIEVLALRLLALNSYYHIRLTLTRRRRIWMLTIQILERHKENTVASDSHTCDSCKKLSRTLGRRNRARRYHHCTGKEQPRYRAIRNISTAHEEHSAVDSRLIPTHQCAYLGKWPQACSGTLMLIRRAPLSDCGSQQLQCLSNNVSLGALQVLYVLTTKPTSLPTKIEN